MDASGQSYTLRDVALLPLHPEPSGRYEFVRSTLSTQINNVYRQLREDLPKVAAAVDSDRTAWAVAFNVTGERLPPESRASIRCYTDVKKGGKRTWGPETAWVFFTREFSAGDSGDVTKTGLWALACSVACEQRQEWQPPHTTLLDPAAADEAFAALWERHNDAVVRWVGKKCHERGVPMIDARQIAHDAWAGALKTYWHRQAKTRFLGQSTIPTLIRGIARFKLADECKALGLAISLDSGGSDETRPAEDPGAPGLSQSEVLLRKAARAAAARHLDNCLALLSGQCRLYATRVYRDRTRPVDAAREFKVTPSAMSQQLRKARHVLEPCLREHGIELEWLEDIDFSDV